MFTREVRGPLKLLKEEWLGLDENVGFLSLVTLMRLIHSWNIAKITKNGMIGKQE